MEWIREVATGQARKAPQPQQQQGRFAFDEQPQAQGGGKGSEEGWLERSKTLGNAQDWRGMLALCRRWTQAEPDSALAWNRLGLAYLALGRHQEAIEAYRESLRLKPDFEFAWHCLATAYAQSGNRAAALEAVEELRRYDPQHAEKLFNLIIKR